jgi:hypothetical protein
VARILVIPDLQIPFHHPDAFAFLKTVAKKYKPNEFVNMGDEVDFCALSDWDSDPDGFSPGHELERAVSALKDFYKIFPIQKVCTSNHTIRPFKRAFKSGIPRKLMRDYKEFLEAPDGWEWRDYWIIDNIRFEHGEGVSGMYAHSKAAQQNMRSTVIGHIHSFAGIQYIACHDRLIFGFNSGCLIDNHTYAFAYGKKIRNKPILGCGIIIEGIPHFIPMILNKRGRWINKI